MTMTKTHAKTKTKTKTELSRRKSSCIDKFFYSASMQIATSNRYISFGAQSIEHGNVLSEKINFSAPGGRKVAIFGMEDLDPQYFDVSNFSVPPDPPYMSKNDKMCYF